ncbi:hypothetical protein JK386_03920 [Nocardioides sp. zg-536]|uniref:Uncharacterized protein n=1 Tax=Nocardioides faecalis TaxID=2803858 RepID=A0A938Y6C1_9ACTN|nr:hypothetical protein [Nocardioides faecalis]MBM9459038.1 hypothetical protein [Nocardioides faecalis]QVI57303.1 hypothetical protein KG111_09180 [Nocardioides faecalis]
MIDISIDGSPENITAWASWLRDSLRATLDDTSDDTAEVRRKARDGWHGDGGEAYLDYNRELVEGTDSHERRVGRGARALDDLAAALSGAQDAMAALRTRAVEGGLVLRGETIDAPAAGVRTDPEDLYDVLAEEAAAVRAGYREWLESNLPAAVSDAEQDDDLDRLVKLIKARYPDLTQVAGLGLNALGEALRNRRAQYLRDSRRSGDPRKRARPKTPEGRRHVEDLTRRSRLFDRVGALLRKASLPLAIGGGIHEGITTGDWVRPAVVIASGMAAGAAVPVLFAGAPAFAVGLAAVGASIAVASAAAYLYDTFEVRDKIEDASTWLKGRASAGGGLIASGWDKVTPW